MRGLSLVALVPLAGCPNVALVLGPAQGEGTSGVQPTTMGSSTGTPPDLPPLDPCDPELGCQNKLDILFVIDNSRTMGEEQLNLARNFSLLIEQLKELEDGKGHKVGADVNIMVTTTDLGLNPKCYTPDVHEDYKAAAAGPISTPCTERLTRFTSIEPPIISVEAACTNVCDPLAPAAPSDQFLHFDRDGDNVMGGGPAEALSCIGPQGVDGCGYESPLEVMLQALNPDACWNDPEGCDEAEWDWIDKPFLRDGATLAIAIITDGADCSVRDFNIMEDQDFMEVDPDDDAPETSAAICWHAGVECEGLDPVYGVYESCVATNKDRDNNPDVADADAVLHPLSRYVDLLAQLGEDREVIMLGVMGVPEVTAYAEDPPYEPIEGGVASLVYRNWRDGQYPDGDILPAEWAAGITAPDKQFQFGIGPGCTAYDDEADISRGQALPPARVRSVCESLNRADDPTTDTDEARVRCCIESICGVDFSPAIRCLTGLVQSVVTPEP
ncbi:MAG TPA: vWA domain-containing protein [Nannocystaceae bacterium]|nr:vWA domain-containing protein [Nannocystaceae bacterium]